jgi:hypothetical protein
MIAQQRILSILVATFGLLFVGNVLSQENLTEENLSSESAGQEAQTTVEQWNFNVFLGKKKIGEHRFTVSSTDDVRSVESVANFKYTVLRIPVYRYQHNAKERWTGNCLTRMEASTNANGKKINVAGETADNGFHVESETEKLELPECVMSFAYWNPDFLEQQSLLNPQTGEYVEVTVEELAEETLQVRGEPVQARRFRLTAYKTDVTLWYSSNNEWLALESVAKGGRIVRYELS